MSVSLNARLDEQIYHVQAACNAALTTTVGDCVYVSLKNYRKARVCIEILNGTTVTGTTVTLKQATAVAGTSEKALAYTRMLANTDVAAGMAMTETAVTSSTFTSDTTNSKRLCYIIDVDAGALDVANGFDCFRVDCTGAVNSTGTVTYDLYGAKNSGLSPMAD